MQVYTCAELMTAADALGGQVQFDAGMADATPVLSGWQHVHLPQDGIALYLSHSRDLVGGCSHNRLSAGITAGFLVEGKADVVLTGHRLQLSAAQRCQPSMLVHLRQDDHFQRYWSAGRAESKVSLHLSQPWLEEHLDHAGNSRAMAAVRRSHGGNQPWLPSAAAVHRATQLFASPPQAPPLVTRLRHESLALDLAAEVLAALSQTDEAPAMSTHLRRCVMHLGQWLESGEADGLSITQMARQLGSNAVDLQRGFQHCHGLSIARYQRQCRLQRAKDALQRQQVPVEVAASIAGYAHTSSFSAAFKRQFGVLPSSVR